MSTPKKPTPEAKKRALLRQTLDRVGDKWTMLVLERLDNEGQLRFTQLRDRIEGVSQKMLTQTLRAMERDGLVSRRVHAVVPPRVDYKITPIGEALSEAVCMLWAWVETHADGVFDARQAYEQREPPARPAHVTLRVVRSTSDRAGKRAKAKT